AAILIVVGFKLAKPKLFIEIYKQGWNQFIPFIVTVVAIILSDLLVGILIGLAVAIFEILWINFKKPYLFNMDGSGDKHVFNFQLSEDVSFLNKASIMKTLADIPEGSKVYLDASKSMNIHPDVKEIISD